MDSITELIDRILALLLLPATFYGAGGALMRRRGKSVKQSLVELASGAFTANMMQGVIADYAPHTWQPVCFFLVGWGGLELVGRVYESAAKGIENRITKKLGGE